jgi:hypothetical protein
MIAGFRLGITGAFVLAESCLRKSVRTATGEKQISVGACATAVAVPMWQKK